MKILHIEDDLTYAKILGVSLKRLGPYEITHCVDGEEALNKVKTQQYDLVICDGYLPENFNGPDIVLILKRQYPNLPIIANSNNESMNQEMKLAGANYSLNKSFLPINLQHQKLWVHLLNSVA